MTMVQEPATAQYGGMPHSALATGLVDYRLAVENMRKRSCGMRGITTCAASCWRKPKSSNRGTT